MKLPVLLLLFLCASKPALCDTIDNWQIFLNDQVIWKFNQNHRSPNISEELKETDTLTIQYNTCSGRPRTVLVFCSFGDSIIGWNDGNYYSDRSEVVLLETPYDSAYWDNAYYGTGKVKIAVRDMYPLLRDSQEPLRFYYLNKSRYNNHFGDVLLFSLELIPPPADPGLRFTLEGTVHTFGNAEPLTVAHATVVVVHEQDTIAAAVSDEQGMFAFPDTLLKRGNIYEIIASGKCWFESKTTIDLRELHFSNDFSLDFSLMKRMDCGNWDKSIYFRQGSDQLMENTDITWYIELLKAHPNSCTVFTLVQPEGESQKQASKRIKAFQTLLDTAGADRNCYTIDATSRTFSAETDPAAAPRIEGMIRSLELPCQLTAPRR